MKTWQKVTLVVLNLAVLPWTVALAWHPSGHFPEILNPFVLAVLHAVATALVVNAYVLARKWLRRNPVNLPGGRRP